MGQLFCHDEQRRRLAREKGLNGVDYVDVDADQLSLTVYFLLKAPPDVTRSNLRIDGGRRVQGIKVTGVRMCRVVEPDLDDCMVVTLDRFGDFSTYRLCLVEPDEYGDPGDVPMAGLDPRYSCVDFSFKVDCPSSLDCVREDECPAPAFDEPELSYLAKDYASFRQLILDRLALIMPDWRERHVPDVGIALVELLAYTGDYLSYHQDAVATEAYLDTCRLRTSVRRHARLVDYVMHEGCNARAWVCVETDTDVTLPADVAFVTGGDRAQPERVLTRVELANVPVDRYEEFAPIVAAERPVYAAHSLISFYSWGDRECCIPTGATGATLHDWYLPRPVEDPEYGEPEEPGPGGYGGRYRPPAPYGGYEEPPPPPERALHLRVGDVLIFEEVLGPETGDPADADPTRRHAVLLTAVEPRVDPVTDEPVVEIEWAADDALPFPLCVSAVGPPPACALFEEVSVARGNVILVDHGRWVRDEALGTVPVRSTHVPCDDAACGGTTTYRPGRFTPRLQERPVTFREAVPAPRSARALMRTQEPRRAVPEVDLANLPLAPGGALGLFGPADLTDPRGLAGGLKRRDDRVLEALLERLSPATRQLLDNEADDGDPSSALVAALLDDLHRMLEGWAPRLDLLDSEPDDRHFVVENDNDGVSHARFGDGVLGLQPPANVDFVGRYRVGNGPQGNVGADTILRTVFDERVIRNVDLRPRNPLSAWGGTAAESTADVKLRAPTQFRRELARAVTAEDYARLAERHPGVQRAAGVLWWTGSWTVVQVAVDPVGGTAGEDLLRDVRERLEPYRRVLHDVTVAHATRVPLRVALVVCVLPGHLRGHVEAALRGRLGALRLPDGSLGFFHPDNLTFGDDIHVSRLVSAVRSVAGVESVEVTALHPLHAPPANEIEEGVLHLGPLEVAQLDNDPDYPENGVLQLTLEGGR